MKRLNKIVSVVTMTVLVHAALCVSILTILCDKVWYMRWTDAIPHRDTLSDVTYNVAMSYIASWVFFCLNVVYKGFRNSEKAKPIVRKICEILLNDSERLKEDLKQKQWTGDLHVENAEADIKSALSKIRPSKSSGTIMPGEHGTFFPGNYMEAWRLDVLSLGSMIDELRHYYNSAPQEFGILADEITTSNFFRLFRDVNLSKVGGATSVDLLLVCWNIFSK